MIPFISTPMNVLGKFVSSFSCLCKTLIVREIVAVKTSSIHILKTDYAIDEEGKRQKKRAFGKPPWCM